ncbi:MAG: hypothetical protein RL023_635, partial [Candidatus Parcubacteria bacterium]
MFLILECHIGMIKRNLNKIISYVLLDKEYEGDSWNICSKILDENKTCNYGEKYK